MLRLDVHAFGCLAAIAVGCLAGDARAADSPAVSFRSARADGSVDRVDARLEAIGEIKQLDADNAVNTSKLQLVAAFKYDERTLVAPEPGGQAMQSLRYYRQAAARMNFGGDDELTPALTESHRLIVVDVQGGARCLFSPEGPLTTAELELIDTQGNSLWIEQLLPTESMRLGDTYALPRAVWAPILGLDSVAECEVQGVVAEVNEETALLELAGTLEAAVEGAETQIDLRGRIQFNRRLSRLTWIALAFQEQRSVGPVGPGLEVKALIKMEITPIETPPELSDERLAGLNLRRRPEVTRLEHRAPSGAWRLFHDREWVVTDERRDQSILRLVDRGEFVAQCTVAEMQKVDPAQMVTLGQFQQDIASSLGDSFGEVVSADQKIHDAGYGEYRVTVDGHAEGLPIRWIYYLITDRQGNQALLAFVVEKDLIARFGVRDRAMVETFRLRSAAKAQVGTAPAPATSRQ